MEAGLIQAGRNKHEELVKKIAIPKDGYIETYLVNESSDDVWPAYRQRQVRPVQYYEHRAIDCPGNPWSLSR